MSLQVSSVISILHFVKRIAVLVLNKVRQHNAQKSYDNIESDPVAEFKRRYGVQQQSDQATDTETDTREHNED